MEVGEVRIAVGREEDDHDRQAPFVVRATRPTVFEARNEIERELEIGDVEYENPRPLRVAKHLGADCPLDDATV
jgi:hypothetical protein